MQFSVRKGGSEKIVEIRVWMGGGCVPPDNANRIDGFNPVPWADVLA